MQEQVFGRFAWLLNGILWNIPFHLYTLTTILADLPLYFLVPLVAQCVRNTWIAVMIHGLLVSLVFVLIVPGIV